MGMDLYPRSRSENASIIGYNWSGWKFLRKFCDTHGIDTDELSHLNDGDYISAKTCRAIAAAIEANAVEYNVVFACTEEGHGHGSQHRGCYGANPAADHAKAWRESGGMRQW